MKKVSKISNLFFVLLLLTPVVNCNAQNTGKSNGWYHLETSNLEASKLIVSVKDFADIKLDSGNIYNKIHYIIAGRLKDEKHELFAKETEKAIGKQIGFLLNSEILCAPRVNMRIEKGRFQISLPTMYDRKKAIGIYNELINEMSDN